ASLNRGLLDPAGGRGRADAGADGGARQGRPDQRPAREGGNGQAGTSADAATGGGALAPGISASRQGQGERDEQKAEELGLHGRGPWKKAAAIEGSMPESSPI